MDNIELLHAFTATTKINAIYASKKNIILLNSGEDKKVANYLEGFINALNKFNDNDKVYIIKTNNKYSIVVINSKDAKVIIGPFYIKNEFFYNYQIEYPNLFDQSKHEEIDTHELMNSIAFIARCLLKKEIHRTQVFSDNFLDVESQNKAAAKTDEGIIHSVVNTEIKQVYDLITIICSMVRSGNTMLVYDTYKNIEDLIPEMMKIDGVESTRGLLLGLLSLVTRSAVKGGVHFELAFQLGKTYLSEFLDQKDLKSFLKTTYQMLSQYTKLVSDFRAFGSEKENNDSYYVIKAKRYINENISSSITVIDIANSLNITPNYLSSLFKNSTGKTILEYVNESKISIAKKMLNYTNHSISEIAFILGYSSQSHFGKRFKEETGMTPKEYLNKLYIDKDNEFKMIKK